MKAPFQKLVVALLCVLAGTAGCRRTEAGTSASPEDKHATGIGGEQGTEESSTLAEGKEATGSRRDRGSDLQAKETRADGCADWLIAQTVAQENGEDAWKSMDALEELARFDSAQIRQVMARVQASAELDDSGKAEVLAFLLPVMAKVDPAGSLVAYQDLKPLFSGDREAILPAEKLLELVAKTHPALAEEWRAKLVTPPDGE